MLGFRRLQQAGDTIVEVLIAIAIIALVLLGAYLTTTKSTQSTEDAQERSEAVQIAQGQIEYLRNNPIDTTVNNCFDSTGNPAATTDNGSPCNVTTGPGYNIVITGSASTTYTVTVSWTGLLTANESVVLYYQTP